VRTRARYAQPLNRSKCKPSQELFWSNTVAMTSTRPYMIRAFYEWIIDNACTPHILVDAHAEGVSVPQQFVNKDGHIVLNIAPTALKDLFMGLDAISFSARFG